MFSLEGGRSKFPHFCEKENQSNFGDKMVWFSNARRCCRAIATYLRSLLILASACVRQFELIHHFTLLHTTPGKTDFCNWATPGGEVSTCPACLDSAP